MAFKRKRSHTASRNVRRKTGFKRRARRSSGRTQSITSKSGFTKSLGTFRAKRLKRRAYNHLLWNSTLFKTHYRSVAATSGTIPTLASASQWTISQVPALRYSVNDFFTSAGGGIDPDGATLSKFASETIVIRGGLITFSVANTSGVIQPVKVQVFLVKTSLDFDPAFIPTSATLGWDPSCAVAFKDKVGKIILKREMILEDGGGMDISWRVPIQKLNQEAYVQERGTYMWIFLVNSQLGVVDAFDYAATYNLSFSGDAIGTT